MNEEDFVTFEQAKKLKELGFDRECLYNYDDYGLQSNGCAYDAQDVDSAWESNNSKEYNPLGWIDAPFLYQVQNWLREEKKIHIIITPLFPGWSENDYSIIIYQCTIVVVKQDAREYEFGYQESYHEALSTGIDQALELL